MKKNETKFQIKYTCTECDAVYQEENFNKIKRENVPETCQCEECLGIMVITVIKD